jgi:hypothetical protein
MATCSGSALPSSCRARDRSPVTRSPTTRPGSSFARWLDDLDGFPCPAEQALLDMRTVDAMQRALVSGATEAP